jgi:hypothetical protein
MFCQAPLQHAEDVRSPGLLEGRRRASPLTVQALFEQEC